MSFWGELKRRNVYKAGAAQAIVAWLIVQATAIVFPHLDFPKWTVSFVIVLLIIGLPIPNSGQRNLIRMISFNRQIKEGE